MYEEYFGLAATPFKLNPDPKFFFGSQSHNKAMAYLHYGLKQAEGFIVITGPVGAGKTMLIGQLLDQLNRSNIVAAQLLTSNIEPDELLAQILSAFRVEPEGEGRTGQLEAFEDYLFDQLNRGRRVLLIMDEAQNLPRKTLEELRMLSNIDYDGTPLFQVFLVGQPEFRETMEAGNMEQLRQRVIASYHLENLSADETREYILHRLSVAGWKGKPSFSDDAFRAIYEETGGRPRRINTLCSRVMLYCSLEELEKADGKVLKTVISEIHEEKKTPEALKEEPKKVSMPPIQKVEREEVAKPIEKAAANSDVVVPIGQARAASRASTPKEVAPKADAASAPEKTSAPTGKGGVMKEKSDKKPASAQVSPALQGGSVLDRLKARRNEVEEDAPPPSEATLKDVASAIAAVSAGEPVAAPAEPAVVETPAAPPKVTEPAPEIEPLDDGNTPNWRKSVMSSVNETRDDLRSAHASVQSLRKSLVEMKSRRGARRQKIAKSLQQAESILGEIRDAWR